MSNAAPRAPATERRRVWVAAQKGARPGARRRVGAVLLSVVPAGLLFAWLVCLGLRLVVQDRSHWILANVVYATPPVVLAVLVGLAGSWWLVIRRWKSGGACLLAAAACAGWGYQATTFRNPPGPVFAGEFRAMFWNVSWGQRGWEELAAEIRRHSPDVVGLVESRELLPPHRGSADEYRANLAAAAARAEDFWRRALPAYDARVSPAGVALLSRLPIEDVRSGILGGNHYTSFGQYLDTTLRVEGEVVHVVVIDIGIVVQQPRAIPLGKLYKVLDGLDGERILLLGDFNTPLDATHLRPLRQRFINAFEIGGNGYAATWPVPLPFLTIDQAWVNEGLQVGRCALGWSASSDHRPIIVDVSLTPP